jgi:hypothetical protein
MNNKIICAILVLTLASLACGFSVNLPKPPAPGPEVTEPITVAAPDSSATRLNINFGAGELHLAPGAQGKLVDGSATYNIADLKPEVTTDGNDITIQQGNYKFNGVPTLGNIKNIWDLKLGDKPMELTVQAGAYDGTLEFGGLALTNLTIKDGAANVKASFASPNLTEMSVLRYETGASNVTITGLANANFNTMIFQAGAGDYDLDFSGTLQHDATVTADCGLSNLTLRIPEGVHVIVTVEGGMSSVNTNSGWSQDGKTYTQAGAGPTLTFIIKMGAGNLTLAK